MTKNLRKNKALSGVLSQEVLCAVAVFLLSFLPRLFLAVRSMPFTVFYDEFSTLADAGILYPLRWTEVLATESRYYGGGFSVLAAFLFYLIKDPLVIYHAYLSILSLIQGLGAVAAFRILRKHFSFDSKEAVLFSVAAGFIVSKRSTIAINESVLYFLIWIFVLMVLDAVDLSDERQKRKIGIILAMLSGYALTVHQRMIIMIPLLIFVWGMFLFIFRKQLFSMPAYVVTYVPVYLLAGIFKKTV